MDSHGCVMCVIIVMASIYSVLTNDATRAARVIGRSPSVIPILYDDAIAGDDAGVTHLGSSQHIDFLRRYDAMTLMTPISLLILVQRRSDLLDKDWSAP